MIVLITAFEPFGGAETNITQSILSLLPNSIADWAIEKVCLPVSSSRIRKLMAAAQIDQVNRLLGYTYSISGVVEHGNAVGATLGFPTANKQ